jgi:hypothetical protein
MIIITNYKSKRSIDGKRPIWVIVDEIGKIVNRNPSKDELKGIKNEPRKPYDTKAKHPEYCCRCKEKLVTEDCCRERDQKGVRTEKWLCKKCYEKDRYAKGDTNGNLQQTIRNCRTGNQCSDSYNAKADDTQELACKLYNWIDLNKENDNHTFPIDCYDPKTGLYHQIQGHNYNCIERRWAHTNFAREWHKKYEDMVCFCLSKDGKTVERIYKFLKKEIDKRWSINIYKNPTVGRYGVPYVQSYEDYRITDEDELRKANDIWKEILERRNKMQNTIKTTKCTDKKLLLEGDN